jgi:hypothetical protein
MARFAKQDWKFWQIKFAQDCQADKKLTVKGFCKENKLHYHTACDYIIKKNNRKILQHVNENFASITKFSESLRALRTDKDAQQYLTALRQSVKVTEAIMLDSIVEFKKGLALGDNLNPKEAGTLALDAASKFRDIARDLRGIPKDEENFGWPITKDFWPHRYQRDFIFDLPSNTNVGEENLFLSCFIGGIRSGKTRCGAEKAGDLAWRNRGFTGAIYAPTYRMLEDSTKAMFLEVLNNKGINYEYKASENYITLFGDTKILFRSMDNAEHLRGTELAWFWIDEGGQMKDATAFNIIMGRCSADAPEVMGLVTTTPNGLNWLYDEVVGKEIQNRSKTYHARTDQNTALSKKFIIRLNDTFDARYAKQELKGLWVDIFAGQAYWNFDRAACVNNDIGYEPSIPLVLAFDLNVDPMCWNVIQQRTHKDGYKIDIILDEIHMRTASTEAAANEFIRRYGPKGLGHKSGVNVYGDSTCRHKTTQTTRTDYRIIKEALEKKFAAVEMYIGRANPRITDSVAAFNARLKNLEGVRKLFINGNKCKETIADLERVFFEPGTRTLSKKDPERTHHTDAIRYYLYKVYPLRQPKVRIG